ncbi:MAG: hypothetical protein IID32_07560 [Planctomycetes bacterium]|nr:hypothetical protein [Planctomycetota bacterium]
MSSQDRSRGIRNFHPEPILDPGRSRNDPSSYTRLYIPNGFSLVYVSAKKNLFGGAKGLYVPPVLIDMQGREHRSVGYALRGNLKGKNYQGLAYSAYNGKGSILTLSDAALGPAAKIQLQDLGGQVDRIVTFYLIGRRSVPVGLLAAWIPTSRSKPTAVWKWDKQIDAVLVPAR